MDEQGMENGLWMDTRGWGLEPAWNGLTDGGAPGDPPLAAWST